MVIVWGQRMYGRIDKLAGSYVGTRFFHIYYLPLIPLSSWLVLEEHDKGSFLGMRVPLQLRSVLAAWLRIFGVIYFVACMAALLSSPVELATTHLTSFLQIGVVGALTAFAWLRLGRLSPLERAARAAYADHVGRFVDPALLEQRDAIKAQAIDQLDAAFAQAFGHDLTLDDSYRSYAAQVQCTRTRGWLCATPGTSNHGLGIAVDIGDAAAYGTAAYRWLTVNGPTYGWHNPAWALASGYKHEPWHWEYVG